MISGTLLQPLMPESRWFAALAVQSGCDLYSKLAMSQRRPQNPEEAVWKSLCKAVILRKVCFGLVFFRLSRYSLVGV
jgi:hypothetical protein